MKKATPHRQAALLLAGCVVILAGCGTAHAGSSNDHSSANKARAAVNVSTELPPQIPGTSYSFAPYTSTAKDSLVSAETALAAAQDTGINAAALSKNASTPSAALVQYSNTLNNDAPRPAWVLWATDVPIAEVGPPGHRQTTAWSGVAEWVIDATTGQYIAAADGAV